MLEFIFKTKLRYVNRSIIAATIEMCIRDRLLSITDNIFINKWIKKGTLLDYPTMHKKAKEVMASLGQDVDLSLIHI